MGAGGQAASHVGDHAETAVLLDIARIAVVGAARIVLDGVNALPDVPEQEVNRHARLGIADGIGHGIEHLRDRAQVIGEDEGRQLLALHRDARRVVALGRIRPQLADLGDQQCLELVLAVAATGTGARGLHDLVQRIAAVGDRLADLGGRDAVALADARLVGNELAVDDRLAPVRPRKQQFRASRRQRDAGGIVQLDDIGVEVLAH